MIRRKRVGEEKHNDLDHCLQSAWSLPASEYKSRTTRRCRNGECTYVGIHRKSTTPVGWRPPQTRTPFRLSHASVSDLLLPYSWPKRNATKQHPSSTLRGTNSGRRILRPKFHEPCILTMREVDYSDETFESSDGKRKGKQGRKKKSGDKSEWTCELMGEDSALSNNSFVDVKGLTEEYFIENQVISGVTTLSVNGSVIEGFELMIPEGATPTLGVAKKKKKGGEKEGRHNRRLAVVGVKTVLVVRVSARDRTTTASESTLATEIFGDTSSLKSQYNACSHGKLQFVQATGNNVANGVTTVTVSSNIAGQSYKTVEGLVTSAVQSQRGTIKYDYVMYCLPPGTTSGW